MYLNCSHKYLAVVVLYFAGRVWSLSLSPAWLLLTGPLIRDSAIHDTGFAPDVFQGEMLGIPGGTRSAGNTCWKYVRAPGIRVGRARDETRLFTAQFFAESEE